MTANYDRSIPAILADLLNEFTALLRKEGQLARAELSEKLTQIAVGLGLALGGAVLLIPALVILLQAAAVGLEQAGFAPHWSSLIIGGGAFLIGLILLAVGVGRLKAGKLMPTKTIHQLQEDAVVAKRQVRPEHEHQRAA